MGQLTCMYGSGIIHIQVPTVLVDEGRRTSRRGKRGVALS
jgi:hypothetical protein